MGKHKDKDYLCDVENLREMLERYNEETKGVPWETVLRSCAKVSFFWRKLSDACYEWALSVVKEGDDYRAHLEKRLAFIKSNILDREAKENIYNAVFKDNIDSESHDYNGLIFAILDEKFIENNEDPYDNACIRKH